jgi:branched-chain amino acid transport system substrate-binding protein
MRYSLLAAFAALLSGSIGAQTTVRVPVDSTGLNVAVHHLAPPRPSRYAPVLFVHGATFPSALAAGYEFDGTSWMGDMARHGFDVWALDFVGYGASDRYPAMREPASAHPALGRATDAARQISAAVAFIERHEHATKVSLVAHSWGTLAAGLYASTHPGAVDRLVLFGPVALRQGVAPDAEGDSAYWYVTEEAQRARFVGYVPAGERAVLDPRHFAGWGPAYMATDSTSRSRTPPSVEVPSGPIADINDAWSGHFPYDPGAIRVPVLIVRGEWDTVTRDGDLTWLFHALTHAPLKREVTIDHGTHVMHLEASRYQLYRETETFLAADDTPPVRSLAIAGFGALTGPVHDFGINSRAALKAAAEWINTHGGVRLADGATGRFDVSYDDDHCKPADAIALVRGYAAGDALVAIGPSCSSVAEPLYPTLDQDSIPVFTDGATKANLARLSPWVFRNSPNEIDMYAALWRWIRQRYPTLKTVYAGQEADFAHSHATWENIIGPGAKAVGFEVLGDAPWSINDTAFADPVSRIKAAHPDIVVLSSHPATTCGALAELHRQGVRPRLVVGLVSSATPAIISRCRVDAEGLLIPTTFAPTTLAARQAAAAVEHAGGVPDLHCMAAWEILMTLRTAIERAKVTGLPETRDADRRAIREALTDLKTMPGLLGTIQRTPDRESKKPFVFVQVHDGQWVVRSQSLAQ